MGEHSREKGFYRLQKKSVKWTLLFLVTISVTVFCFSMVFIFAAWSGRTSLSSVGVPYQESEAFGRDVESFLSEILYAIWDNEEVARVNADSPQEDFLRNESNLSFCLVFPKSNKIYSNRTDITAENYRTVFKDLKEQEPLYLFVTEKSMECQGTIPADLSRLRWELQDLFNEEFILGAAVKEGFPIRDQLFLRYQMYEKYRELVLPAICMCVLTALVSAAGLLLLTLGAGREPEDSEIHLNRFDRWNTEISAFLVVFLWAFPFAFCMELEACSDELAYTAGAVAGAGFVTILFFLWGYLSLVRRYKAGILWKNSLFCKCLIIIKKLGKSLAVFVREVMMKNLSETAKVLAVYLAYFVLQFICFCSGGFGLFVLILLNLMVVGGILLYLTDMKKLKDSLQRLAQGNLSRQETEDEKSYFSSQREMQQAVRAIGSGFEKAVEDSLKNERMKTELLTNVSHDIKTPLTSIISYVDLLKRENLEDPKVRGYLDVLEKKAQRLKILTEDVVEASKASTGNMVLEMRELNLTEMVQQVLGDFEEKFSDCRLELRRSFPEQSIRICADGRKMWRVLSNLFGNISRYSMEETRVYVDLYIMDEKVVLELKNISKEPLNISPEELTERFVRGDSARNTEGSGLGLSIAKSLVELMGGNFVLTVDGDLFKTALTFTLLK